MHALVKASVNLSINPFIYCMFNLIAKLVFDSFIIYGIKRNVFNHCYIKQAIHQLKQPIVPPPQQAQLGIKNLQFTMR